MIAFQVSLIFEPVKEIYTENMSDLYLMKKVTILRKVLVTMKTFVPLFFNQFSLSLNRKQCWVTQAMRKKQNIFVSGVNLLHIRIGNLNFLNS